MVFWDPRAELPSASSWPRNESGPCLFSPGPCDETVLLKLWLNRAEGQPQPGQDRAQGCPWCDHCQPSQAQQWIQSATTRFYQKNWHQAGSDRDKWISQRSKPWLTNRFSEYSHLPSLSCVRRGSAAPHTPHSLVFCDEKSKGAPASAPGTEPSTDLGFISGLQES